MGIDYLKEQYENMVTGHLQQLCRKYDEIFIEGLKRWGYEFSNEQQLIQFTTSRCTRYTNEKVDTYTIDGEPFLVISRDYNYAFGHLNGNFTAQAATYNYKFIKRKKMKTEVKEIETIGTPQMEVSIDNDMFLGPSPTTVKLIFELRDVPQCSLDSIKLTGDFEMPTKVKEFCDQKGISKEELVEWLNENYK